MGIYAGTITFVTVLDIAAGIFFIYNLFSTGDEQIDHAKGKSGGNASKIVSLVKKGIRGTVHTALRADQLKAKTETFDKAATDLVSRVEGAMVVQEQEFRQIFEEEMQKLKGSYEERLKLAVDREQQLNEERLNNRLLQQAVDLIQKKGG